MLSKSKKLEDITYRGGPCKNGHSGLRYKSGGACVDCSRSRPRVSLSPEQLQRMKESSREWYLRNKERRSLEQKQRRAANIPAYKDEQRRSYQKNKEKRKMYDKIYYRANKEKVYAKAHRRRARQRGAPGNFTEHDVKRIFSLQSGKCAACKRVLDKFHRDHIIPLVQGGDNSPGNIQLLCESCNLHKHAKHPVEFMQELGYLL